MIARGAASSSMNAIRSRGAAGSIGRDPAPAPRQRGHHERRGGLETDRDDGIGVGVVGSEGFGQGAGLLVELSVRQRDAAVGKREGVWGLRGLKRDGLRYEFRNHALGLYKRGARPKPLH